MTEKRAKRLLKLALKDASPTPSRHKWQDIADVIGEFGITDASPRGFTVEPPDQYRDFDFPYGLAPEHYEYFAPYLKERGGKALLAKGTVESELLSLGCDEFDTAWRILRDHLGENELDSLPSLVERKSVATIAAALAQAVVEYRMVNPRRVFAVDVRACRVSWLGKDYPVSEEQALFLDLLYMNLGKHPLTEKACIDACPRLAGGHFRRNLWQRLPDELQTITKSKQGYGWWLELD